MTKIDPFKIHIIRSTQPSEPGERRKKRRVLIHRFPTRPLSKIPADVFIPTKQKIYEGSLFVQQMKTKGIKFDDNNLDTKQFKKLINKLLKEYNKCSILNKNITVQLVLNSLLQHANDLSQYKTQKMCFSSKDIEKLLSQETLDPERLDYFINLPLVNYEGKRLPLNGKILCSLMELSKEEYQDLRQNCPPKVLDFELSYSGKTPFNCKNFLKILPYFSSEDIKQYALNIMSMAQLAPDDFSLVENILQTESPIDAEVFASPIIRVSEDNETVFDPVMYDRAKELKKFLQEKNITSERTNVTVNKILDSCYKKKNDTFNIFAYQSVLDLFEYYKNAETVASIAEKCSHRTRYVFDFEALNVFKTEKFDKKVVDDLLSPKGSLSFELTDDDYALAAELLGSRFSIDNIRDIFNIVIKHLSNKNYADVTNAIIERKNDFWKNFYPLDVLFSCITRDGRFDEKIYDKFRKLDSITDKSDLGYLFNSGRIISFFLQFEGKNSIHELSKKELDSLFEIFISSNSLLINPSIKKCMKEFGCDALVPKDQEEFCAILNDILDVRKNAFPPLEEEAEEKFNKALIDIVKPLKHLKFSNPIELAVSPDGGQVNVVSKKQPNIAADLEKPLNAVYEVFPELLSEIGRVQNGAHEFTLDIHTLKVLKGIFLNPNFQLLSTSDQKVLKLAALFHDYTKAEGKKDFTHPTCSAHEAYYILSKLHLSEEERRKIYTLINTHHWLEMYSKAQTPKILEKIITSIAFDLQKDNLFEMSTMLAKADLQAVSRNNKFYEKHHGVFHSAVKDIQTKIDAIKSTRIYIPQTTIPKASKIPVDGDIVRRITTTDYSGNETINVVVDLQDGIDLRKYGFSDKEAQFLVHLTYDDVSVSLLKTMQTPESKAILSTSLLYKNKLNGYHGRKLGVILAVKPEDIIAAYKDNFGSGCKKDLHHAKEEYFIDKAMSMFREYFSQKLLICLRIDKNKYLKLYEKIKNKSFEELKDEFPNIANILDHLFTEWSIGGGSSNKNNEILVYQPKVAAIFARNTDDVSITLRKYAANNDLPIIVLPEKENQ